MATYTVQSGQTLSGIVRAHLAASRNIAESQVPASDVKRGVDEVARLNGISDPNRIRAGQELALPDSFVRSSGPAPELGAARPGGWLTAGSVLSTMLSSGAAGSLKSAGLDGSGHLVATTKAGVVDLGALDGGGSRGSFWTTPDKSALLFSKNTGGGYENEDQSLFLLDGKTGQVRPLLSRDDGVAIFDDVKFTNAPDGRPLALATEADGGLGKGTTHLIDLGAGRVLGAVDGRLDALAPAGGQLALHLTRVDENGDESQATVTLADALKARRPVVEDAALVGGELVVTVGAEAVGLGSLDGGGSRGAFWTTPDGSMVLFSKNTGGGFENEDQTLYAFDAKTKSTRALLGDGENPAIFDGVQFVAGPSGGMLALASEADGGLGAGTTHVVDLGSGRYLGSVDGALTSVEGKGFDLTLKLDVMDRDLGESRPGQASLESVLDDGEGRRLERASASLERIVSDSDRFSDDPSIPYRAVPFGEIEAWLGRYFGPAAEMWRMSTEDREQAAKLLDEMAPAIAMGTRHQVHKLVSDLLGLE